MRLINRNFISVVARQHGMSDVLLCVGERKEECAKKRWTKKEKEERETEKTSGRCMITSHAVLTRYVSEYTHAFCLVNFRYGSLPILKIVLTCSGKLVKIVITAEQKFQQISRPACACARTPQFRSLITPLGPRAFVHFPNWK